MIGDLRRRFFADKLWTWLVMASVLLGAALLGYRVRILWLIVLVGAWGAVALVHWPPLGLLALVLAALVMQYELGTGTEVALNPATVLVPLLLGIWLLDMVRRRDLRLVPSRTNKPLLLFLLAGLLSLLIGNVLWDPAVPRADKFILVQLAQWAVFAFSAGAFWLTGNLVRDEIWLRRLTFFGLALAGSLAVLLALPASADLVGRQVATFAVHRTPFWLLLAALAGGQLLFNGKLSTSWRVFLLASLGGVAVYAFYLQRATASHWVSVVIVMGVLAWLRFPRLRGFFLVLLVVLAAVGVLSSAVYDFAGGDAEWAESGGSRLALIGRVIEVTMRNPITGLGPAAYRPYARMTWLPYRGALWLDPLVNSHNNYVDLFSHVGLLGLGLFFWFAVEVIGLGLRLRGHFTEGFAAGYVNAMLAAWASALTVMLFADWMLPFVYNIGFPGFQASVLVWLFLGGLVALEQLSKRPDELHLLCVNRQGGG